MNDRTATPPSTTRDRVDIVLPKGARLGPFEVQRLISRGASSFVYLATDHALAMPVALQEYLPMRLVYRDPWLHLHASDPTDEDILNRGMQVFIEESRLLARCEHPALMRVNHLFEAHGSAYRVMPFQPGRRLDDVRRQMAEPPPESALRALLDTLLGALETIHQLDQVHGGVTAANILLSDQDLPVLLAPGAAAREIRSDLVESLMATVESQPGALLPEVAPTGPSIDLCALAEVMRFCITGEAAVPGTRPHEPLSVLLGRGGGDAPMPVYSTEFISTLDAATSSSPEDWPTSVAQCRLWLTHGAPAARAAGRRTVVLPRPVPVAAPPQAAVAAYADPMPVPLPFSFSEPVPRAAEPVFAPLEATPAPPAPRIAASPEAGPVVARTRVRRIGPKLLFGGALAALGVVIIAWVSGAWTLMPPLSLDRDSAVVPVPTLEPTGAGRASVGAPPATTYPAPAASAPVAAAVPPAAPAEPAPLPPVQSAADTTVAPDAAAQDGPATQEPSSPVAAAPAAPSDSRPPSARRPPRAPRLAAAPAVARATADPRSACTGKTEFALYRCMVQQCQAAKWTTHPQCVRLRLDDQIN